MFGLNLCSEKENRFSGRLSGCFAVAVLLGSLSATTLPAQAAYEAGRDNAKPPRESTTKIAAQDPETTGSIQSQPNTEANCARSRMRLWVEGEGWIVRKVTTCY
jgi:hypothetical protein